MISISDSIDAQDDNPEDVSEIIESFRQKAVNLLELLDLSIPTIAKLRVNINIKYRNNKSKIIFSEKSLPVHMCVCPSVRPVPVPVPVPQRSH